MHKRGCLEPHGCRLRGVHSGTARYLALYKTHENFDDPLAAAEAYRGVLYTIVGSIKSGALMSHEYPRAMRGVDWTSKAGLDNPDNNYFFALLDDEGSYRLYGKRGNTTQLIFQLVIGVRGG